MGQQLSDEDVAHLDGIDQYTRGRDKAMRMLALRSRSKREIDDALRAMNLRDTIRTGIVRELEEIGLVDDARFAREFVAVKKDVRRVGPHRLRYDLGKLGLARTAVDEALSDFGAEEQLTMARALAEKQLGASLPNEKLVRRVIGMLRRKGYDYSVVNKVAYELARRIPNSNATDDIAMEPEE
ncbi:MAG TPA: RecX family transcriptional regulator [Candidatus Krumholzibacteria bacterium]|nr:RecX family transcriptional regulator [Candidatus Krumholzibacteria bacterium]